jgi:hypothetical protein
VQIAVREHGHFVFHWPKDFHLGAEANAQIAVYWTPMPMSRRVLLFAGLLAIVFVNVLVRWARRLAGVTYHGTSAKRPATTEGTER